MMTPLYRQNHAPPLRANVRLPKHDTKQKKHICTQHSTNKLINELQSVFILCQSDLTLESTLKSVSFEP